MWLCSGEFILKFSTFVLSAKKRKGSGADAIHDEDSIFVSMVTKAGAVLTASKASPNQLSKSPLIC